MDLEITILSEVREKSYDIICYHLYLKSKKDDTNDFIYRTETDSQTSKTNLWLLKGKGEGGGGKLEGWD